MACQVCHSGLTQNQSKDIANIQKKAIKTILGRSYYSYEVAYTPMPAQPLSDRFIKFIIKAAKSGLHFNHFKIATKKSITTRRSNKKL